MSTKQRKPMTFDIDRSPKMATELKDKASSTESPVIEKQQIGVRIPTIKYRQLKAKAALNGVSVQTLVEQAIDQLLANPD